MSHDNDIARLCGLETIVVPDLQAMCDRLALVVAALLQEPQHQFAKQSATRALEDYQDMLREHHQRLV